MTRRQSIPKQWLIVNHDLDRAAIRRLRHLPRGSGVLIIIRPRAAEARHFRNLAVERELSVVLEAPAAAARVHDMRELTRARLRRTPLVLISPIYPTRTHPDWAPLPRMRAATLARMAGRKAIALGGMNDRRFSRVHGLGFVAWAGVSAWLKVTNVTESGTKGVTLRRSGPLRT